MTPISDCREANDPPRETAAAPQRTTAGISHQQGTNSISSADSKDQTTLGWSLFHEPLAGACTPRDIRHRLELKYVACLATGGTNGFPLHIDQIRDPRLRAIAAQGMNMALRGWNERNLLAYRDPAMIDTATGVLLATLDRPVWGNHDFILMSILDSLDEMEDRAVKGGVVL